MRIIKYDDGTILNVYEPGDKGAELTASDIEMDKRARAAVKAELDRARICGKPIARYDIKTRRAYLEYPDGRRKYYGENKANLQVTGGVINENHKI